MSPYSILGISESSTPEEVKAAYRKAVKKYHPDVAKDDASKAKFLEIQQAYEDITNPSPRRQDPPPNSFGFTSPFGFNFGFHPTPQNMVHQVMVDLSVEEAFRGTIHKMIVQHDDMSYEISVDIPPMTLSGTMLRVGGLPDTMRNVQISVIVMIRDDGPYRAMGSKIATRLTIDFITAILGGEIEVTTLDGPRYFSVKSGTQHGDMVRLPGLGFPLHHGAQQRDDFVVILDVHLPTSLTPAQKRVLEEYRSLS